MTDHSHLFTKLAQTHKVDCAFSLDGPLPQAAPCPDELALTLGSDAVGRYAAACRPVYEDLRRIVGQISGLLILARLTTQRQVLDLPEFGACQSRMKQAQDRLNALPLTTGTNAHRKQLEAALAFSRLAVGTFPVARDTEAFEAALDLAGLQVKRAYAHLRAATAVKAGLEMVDLSHACCCGHEAKG